MRFPYAQVSFFHDGIAPFSKGKRGQTVLLARTGSPVSPSAVWREVADRCEAIPGFGPVSDQWVVHSSTVNQTRVWACSMAKFTLTRPYHGESIIMLPPFHPEMPIVVDHGYVDSLYAEVIPDMVVTAAGFGEWHLIRRRFMGYIDTMTAKVSNKRVICTIIARDKMRFLVDNRMVGFFDPNKLATSYTGELTSGAAAENVQTTLQDYYDKVRTGAGDDALELGQGMARQVIVKALIEYGSGGGISPEDLSVGTKDYGNITGFKDGKLDENAQVRAAIATGEKSDLGALSNSFTVMNKAPIEPLKRLSTLETTLPKELYADHNGKVYWKERVASRPDAPHQFHLLANPDPSNVHQSVISVAAELSSVGTINGLIVVNPMYATNGTTPVVAASAMLDPMQAFGFFMLPRVRYLFDETLGQGEHTEALVRPIIDAQFMIWGKDIRGADMETLGRPDIFVGDATRVSALPYFSYAPEDARNTLRVDALVDQVIGEGPKKGYRTRTLLTVALTAAQSGLVDKMVTVNRFNMPVPQGTDQTNEHEAKS